MNYSVVIVAEPERWPGLGEMSHPLGHILGEGRKASPNGEEPATHLYLHDNSSEYKTKVLLGLIDPEPTEDHTVPEIKAAISSITVSVNGIAREDWDSFDEDNPRPAPLWGREHVDAVLARLGLQKVAGPELI